MRASFQGQNIFALGNGIAVLKSAWSEAEPPQAAEEEKKKLKRDVAALAKSVLAAGK
ncbi:MAG: hypothetical protein H0U98_06215 [Alphaproteobacteria bacterium]|nr:hypothetical protein [Alphaproteobacteria bacterium]